MSHISDLEIHGGMDIPRSQMSNENSDIEWLTVQRMFRYIHCRIRVIGVTIINDATVSSAIIEQANQSMVSPSIPQVVDSNRPLIHRVVQI